MSDPLDLLARSDKWQLSAGEGLVFAPPFPRWLDEPGFWDEAHLFEYPLGPLFTVTWLDAEGAELPLVPGTRRWTPAALEQPYLPAGGIEAVETRMVLPGFVLGSEWAVRNAGPEPLALHAVAWTTAPGEEVPEGGVGWSSVELSWPRRLVDRKGQLLDVMLKLALARGTDSWAAVRAEATADLPRWRLTPFWDRWDARHGGLACRADLGGIGLAGLVYLGLHRAVEIPAGGTVRLAVAMRVEPDLPRSAPRARHPSAARRVSSFAAASRASWEDYLSTLPTFRCSDPYFERYWAYRWYGLRLNGIAGGWGQYPAPTVCEGIGYFHQPIAYSAPAHMRELRWSLDPEPARGVLRTFVARQRDDGSFPGRVYANHAEGVDFYHADWGGALLALDAVHPSDDYLREVLPALERYAEWLLAARDAQHTHLIDVLGQYETGQEFMSRYLAVDPDADRYGWERDIRLKGVDATVYGYTLFRALALLAPRAGMDGERWRDQAQAVGEAIRRKMWDPGTGMFSDVAPATGRRTRVKAAVCFYPYATDAVRAEHLPGFAQNLFDARAFWTPFPVPSSSADDPLFDPDASWKGKRHNCPWNGRVWPMANSHVAEAIAAVALGPVPVLRVHLAEFVTKFVRMLFWDGDASRPNAFEHYHPVTGRPSAYRGIDDYQHSWVNDLMVQYVVGLRPAGEGRLVVDPMPCAIDGLDARGLPMQGSRVDVQRDGDRLVVSVEGREAGRGTVGSPIEVTL
jgi:Mannosylglycerate hydrolase MGH1-like glycoside hydrolase domain